LVLRSHVAMGRSIINHAIDSAVLGTGRRPAAIGPGVRPYAVPKR